MRFQTSFFRVIGVVTFLAAAGSSVFGGQYTQNFDSFAVGATNFGDGSQLFSSEPAVVHVEDPALKELQLSQWDTTNQTRAAFLLPDLDPSAVVTHFSASWVSPVYGNFPSASVGFSFSFGTLRSNDLAAGTYTQERGFDTGLTLWVQTFATTTTPGWYLKKDGTVLASVTNNALATWGNFSSTRHAFQVSWDQSTGLSVSQDNVVIFTNVPTPGFVAKNGDAFVWATRTGGGIAETFRIDNVSVTTVSQGPPSIVSATATNGLLPKATVVTGVNSWGLATTLICEVGTNLSYGIKATNIITGTPNGVITYVTNALPIDTDRCMPLHARVTVSNALGTATTGDIVFASSSWERRLGEDIMGFPSAGMWMDIDDDGLLDLANSGDSGGTVFRNPGTGTNWPQSTGVLGVYSSIIIGDFDNDNRPDSLWVGAPADFYGIGVGSPATVLYGRPSPAGYGLVGFEMPFYMDAARGVARDFDHDGRQDLLLTGMMSGTGSSNSEPLVVNGSASRLLRNEFSGLRGASNFRFMTCNLPQ